MASLRARLERVGLVAALPLSLAGIWVACGGGGDSRGSGGSAGSTGGTAGASGSSGGGGSGAATADGNAGGSGGEPCKWPGWYRAPRLPAGCTGLCIPDDVKKRVPSLTWSARDDICPGCKGLDTPWMPADAGLQPDPVAAGVRAAGDGKGEVYVAEIGLHIWSGPSLNADFDSMGAPLAAWATDGDVSCGSSRAVLFGDGLAAFYSFGHVPGDQGVDIRPIDQLPALMTSTQSSFVFTAAFLGVTGPNEWWFSKDLVAADMSGHTAIGEIATGTSYWFEKLPGAPPGQWTNAQLVGKTVFATRYDFKKNDWWVYENGKLQLFLGADDLDIRDLVTDGQVIVWSEGSQPSLNDGGGTVFARYDLYKAPYTSDPSTLQRTLLVPNINYNIDMLQLANGYVSGVYYRDPDLPTTPTDAFVARVSDGWAAKSELPTWLASWGFITYPAGTELWGGAGADASGGAKTILRMPYAAMTLLEASTPNGGG